LLGSPGTRILVDSLNFDDDVRQGGRFAVGYRFETIPGIGVEAGYFFLPDRPTHVGFSSGGDPVLAQPFTDSAGMPNALFVAKPGMSAGTVTVGAQTGLWGTEANLTSDLIRSDRLYLSGSIGLELPQFPSPPPAWRN
jgi:hypothetical protein